MERRSASAGGAKGGSTGIVVSDVTGVVVVVSGRVVSVLGAVVLTEICSDVVGPCVVGVVEGGAVVSSGAPVISEIFVPGRRVSRYSCVRSSSYPPSGRSMKEKS